MTARNVLIIGSGSAIALAIASRFIASGDRVLGASRSPHDELIKHVVADCSDPDESARVVTEACDYFGGPIDVLVLGASYQPRARAEVMTDEQWTGALNGTLNTAFYPTRAALPRMRDGGAIVFISSVVATTTSPGLAGYAAAKGAIDSLTKVLALECGARGIRVNGVAPGLIGGAALQEATVGYALRRTGTPDEVAGAVHFLASDDASFITGVTLRVDGGLGAAQVGAWARPDLRQLLEP